MSLLHFIVPSSLEMFIFNKFSCKFDLGDASILLVRDDLLSPKFALKLPSRGLFLTFILTANGSTSRSCSNTYSIWEMRALLLTPTALHMGNEGIAIDSDSATNVELTDPSLSPASVSFSIFWEVLTCSFKFSSCRLFHYLVKFLLTICNQKFLCVVLRLLLSKQCAFCQVLLFASQIIL